MTNEFQGNLGKYRVTQTHAGDWTIYSEFFDENCHSLEGSIAETDAVYIQGTELKAQAEQALREKRPLSILEVGFGAGVGAARAWNFAQTIPEQSVYFCSLELDADLARYALHLGPFADCFKAFCKVEHHNSWRVDYKNFHLHILLGDAKQTIRQLVDEGKKFDAFFHDPFGPQKNPSLWTVEIFQNLKSLTYPTSVLTTYSSAIAIRKAMLEAQWAIEEFPGFGLKKSSTRARPSGRIENALLEKLGRSPIGALRQHPGLVDGKVK